jgi:hypothetical protein
MSTSEPAKRDSSGGVYKKLSAEASTELVGVGLTTPTRSSDSWMRRLDSN